MIHNDFIFTWCSTDKIPLTDTYVHDVHHINRFNKHSFPCNEHSQIYQI